MAKLSVCMIVKNEEQFLKNALASVKHIADEIIVVDTGSIDSTPEIALQFTPNLFNFKWNDDFAQARNFSISKATGDWIFILDADESISVLDQEELKNLITNTNPEVSAYAFHRRNYTNQLKAATVKSSQTDPYPESKMAAGYVEETVIRLFRNLPKIKFESKIHATVQESAKKLGKINMSGIPIHHFGELKFGWDEKKALHEKIYQQSEKEAPSARIFSLHGQELLAKGETQKAISCFSKSAKLDPLHFPAWLGLANGHLIKGDLFRAKIALAKAFELNRKHFFIYLAQGIILTTERDFKGAMQELRQALRLAPKNATIHYYIGLCFHAQGNKEKAYLAFKNACELNPSYKAKVKFE